jgi:hypothetical protein
MKRNILTAILIVLFLSCSVQKEYEKAITDNNVNGYTYFLRMYPKSKYSRDIRNRLSYLYDDIAWDYAKRLNTEKSLEQYLNQYPYGNHRYQAITEQNLLATKRIEEAKIIEEQNAWQIALYYNNISSYRKYINEYRYGKHAYEAQQKIKELELPAKTETPNNSYNNNYSDNVSINEKREWEKAKKLNTITSYKAYLKKYPYGAFSTEAEEKIIDKEVSTIMAGKHGEMPAPQRSYSTNSYKITSDISITNSTRYTLTVLYSGPSSKKIVISPSYSSTITLSPGYYKVAAKVSSSSVRPFAGTHSLQSGNYNSNFYIQTNRGGYGGLPYNGF